MGIGDLFSIFAGGAWLATETAKEIGERAVGEKRSRLIKAYIAEHTDPELEQRMMEDVKNPDMYDAVWERIESFKRDNPVFCDEEAKKSLIKKYDGTYGYTSRFGWQNVGEERLPFRTANGSLYGKSQYQDLELDGNRNIAVMLLMQTYGKMKLSHAKTTAEKLYPIPKTNRNW